MNNQAACYSRLLNWIADFLSRESSGMEFVVCLAGGLALICCGVGLFLVRPPNWQCDGEIASEHLKAIQWWSGIQRYVRLLNNSLLIVIGMAIAASGFIRHGKVWMLLWSVILVLLLVCILFAMVDAFSSLAGYRRALPEAARRSFGNQQALAGEADPRSDC